MRQSDMSVRHTRARMSRARTGIGIALALLAGGCSGEPEPLIVPEVVWPKGEPSGALESDPWVQAVRDSVVLFAAAWNAHDWSDPALLELMSGDIVHRTAMEQGDQFERGEYFTAVGPLPFEPLSVEETGVDSARVLVCEYTSWVIAPGQAEAEFVGQRRTYYDLKRDEEGVVRVMRTIGDLTAGCDGEEIKPTLFDPAPEILDGLDEGDVREAEPKRR